MATITRHNWKEFATEPQLTPSERKAWVKMARTVKDNDELMTSLIEATDEEKRALTSVMETEDWRDMAERHDALMRLQRAELAWWRERARQERLL